MNTKQYIHTAKSTIFWVLCIVLFIFILNLTDERRRLRDEIESYNAQYTDTVYVKKPFVPGKGLDYRVNPKTISIYPPFVRWHHDTVYVHTIGDTVYIQAGDSDTLKFGSSFFTMYPASEKLIQVDLESKKLELTLLDHNGTLYTKKFKINTNRYRYRYSVNNELTSKKVSFIKNFHPTIGVTFMPINLGLDANLGLRYNHNKVEYEVGFKTLYYPNLSSKPKFDLYIGISYTF